MYQGSLVHIFRKGIVLKFLKRFGGRWEIVFIHQLADIYAPVAAFYIDHIGKAGYRTHAIHILQAIGNAFNVLQGFQVEDIFGFQPY